MEAGGPTFTLKVSKTAGSSGGGNSSSNNAPAGVSGPNAPAARSSPRDPPQVRDPRKGLELFQHQQEYQVATHFLSVP